MSFPFEYDRGPFLPFGGTLPHVATFEESRAVILPVPVDRTTSYVGGTRNGPRELLIASRHEASGVVLVAVKDVGIGLDPQGAERVFEPFYTTKAEGLGMGLTICRSIIEAHGGRLWASADEPSGAVFRFTLPPIHDETAL